MTQLRRPLPQPTPETEAYWDGCRRGEVVLPRCRDCGRFHFYPRALCPHCWSAALDHVATSGRGRLYSYVINHRPAPGFEDRAPYIIAVVELEEGVRVLSNLVGIEPDASTLSLDMPVEVVFEEVSSDITLPLFKPMDEAER